MIKCLNCENHRQRGHIHNCTKCETKKVYGQLQDLFIEGCGFFSESKEVKRYNKLKEEYQKALAKLYKAQKENKRIKYIESIETKVYELDQKLRGNK